MSIASPCISVCRMNPALALTCGEAAAARGQGICEGCYRTIDEIVAWGTLRDAQRVQVWQNIMVRAQRCGSEPPPGAPDALNGEAS